MQSLFARQEENSPIICGGNPGGKSFCAGAASGVPAWLTNSSQMPLELVCSGRCSNRSAWGPIGVHSSFTVKVVVVVWPAPITSFFTC